jgi:glycosyltransferase involved in cell wall biosynthesis
MKAQQFDVIDTPAISATSLLQISCKRLVARSVQPELRYIYGDIMCDLRNHFSPRALLHAVLGVRRAAAILAGWRRAGRILCLGGLELRWMQERFPGFRPKLRGYTCAPVPSERALLLKLRGSRLDAPPVQGTRYLWIGRWSAQKGTSTLLRYIHERLLRSSGDSLTIAGCGERARRDVPAAALHSGRVCVLPEFSRAELPGLLSRHDVGLFTSPVEGWGLSLVEMLESGMPVFATEAGAVDDIRRYFPASLRTFPPAAEPLHREIEDLEANGYLDRFDWDRIAKDYEDSVLC